MTEYEKFVQFFKEHGVPHQEGVYDNLPSIFINGCYFDFDENGTFLAVQDDYMGGQEDRVK